MRIQYRLIILIVLIGCSKPQPNENQTVTQDSTESTKTEILASTQEDNFSYVGFVYKNEDNNSFYTDLYFVDNFNYDLYNQITELGDRVVYQDNEIKRTRIDIEKVRQYFNLTGLNNINLFNRSNQKLTSGTLSHVEYVEDMIESRFTAVFKVDNPNISDTEFCIGNSNDELVTIDFSPYESDELKLKLIEHLKLKTDHVSRVSHYRLNQQAIYSTVSADTTSYIIETIDNTHNILYKSNFSETINRIVLVSKTINGRQIILADCGMPETDMMWNSLLTFNGKEYTPSIDHRIKIK